MRTIAAGLPSAHLLPLGQQVRPSPWLWIWPALFVAHFFLPYVPGTRLRFEVATLLIGLVAPLSRTGAKPLELELFSLAALPAVWSAIRIGMSPGVTGISVAIIQWINLNFSLLAIGLYLLNRERLQRNHRDLVWYTLCLGIVNNAIAAAQCWMPDLAIHRVIYAYYGGTISADYDAALMSHTTVAMSNAEFLAKMGGRYTGILATSHMLSVLNVWLVGLSYAVFKDPQTSSGRKQIALLSMLLALVGGMLSGGKMFYLGVALALSCMLVLRRQFTLMFWMGIAGTLVICTAPLFLNQNSEMYRVFNGDLSQILAARYSSDGYLAETLERIWSDRGLQLWGVGADIGGLIVADSLYLLPLVTGGLPLLLLYTLPFVWLLVKLAQRSTERDEYLPVLFCLHLSFLISGIGVPIYQMGRLAPLFWITTLAFVFAPPSATEAARPAPGRFAQPRVPSTLGTRRPVRS